MSPSKGVWVFLALVAWTSVPAEAKWTIAVDSGPFPTAQAAAQAEKQVQWLDADRADDSACTQCFAALELQRYLRRMTGHSDDFAVTDHAHLPSSGDVIVVGRPVAASGRVASPGHCIGAGLVVPCQRGKRLCGHLGHARPGAAGRAVGAISMTH